MRPPEGIAGLRHLPPLGPCDARPGTLRLPVLVLPRVACRPRTRACLNGAIWAQLYQQASAQHGAIATSRGSKSLRPSSVHL